MNHTFSSVRDREHSRHEVRVVGQHDYATIVATYHREPSAFIVARLFAAFGADFAAAADAFTRKEWIYLAWVACGEIHALTNPAFNVANEISRRAKVPCDIVPDRLSPDEVASCAESIPTAAARLDPDVAKAAWVVLSTVRILNRCSDVVEEEPWYEPAWYEDLLPPVPSWRVVVAPSFRPSVDPEYIDEKF